MIGCVATLRRNLTAQHSQIRQRISHGLILRIVALVRIQASLDGAVCLLNLLRQSDWIQLKQRRFIAKPPVILLIFVQRNHLEQCTPIFLWIIAGKWFPYRYRYNVDASRRRNSCLFAAVQSAPLTAYPGHC